jgi:hypothetical protein
MCYEHFENQIDCNSLVYPAPIDDEEDFGESGISLVDLLP